MSKNREKNIVVIGGGTGTFTVLSGLKEYPVHLSAIVAMSDSGGSTGRLRNELGTLPLSDVRQCLIALSNSPQTTLELMNYRYESGDLKGHNVGSLLLSALEKVTGDVDSAIAHAAEMFSVNGDVIPCTVDDVHLVAECGQRIIEGEHEIDYGDLRGLSNMYLKPSAVLNPRARKALEAADLIVVGPGDLYSSIIPNFLVGGMKEAVNASFAQKVYISNLMTQTHQTDTFTVRKMTEEMEKWCECTFDYVLYNTSIPSDDRLAPYMAEGERELLQADESLDGRYIGVDLLSGTYGKQNDSDALRRSLVRHDPRKLAKEIVALL